MEEDGILMLTSPSTPTSQLIIAWKSETAMDPNLLDLDVSIEVADVDAAHELAKEQGVEIVRDIRDAAVGRQALLFQQFRAR